MRGRYTQLHHAQATLVLLHPWSPMFHAVKEDIPYPVTVTHLPVGVLHYVLAFLRVDTRNILSKDFGL